MFDPQHFFCDLVDMFRRHFEAGLLILQKGFYVPDLRQLKEGIELSPCIEKDIQGPDLFSAGGGKIRGVAFEDVRQVDAQPIDLAPPEGIHIVFGDQGPFTLLDPGQLDFLMPVQVRIKMGKDIFLHDDRFVTRHWDGELQYFHHGGFWQNEGPALSTA
jgi:hypothetical protein